MGHLCAQFDTGTVLGTVRDKTGGAISGAKVTLNNTGTGIQAVKTTDGEGNFEFSGVKVGRYKVIAEQPGFWTAFTNEVPVNVNTRQRVHLELAVGQVSETVEVTGAANILETDSSQRGQVVSAMQAVALPLNGRNYSSLVLLTTGVRQSSMAPPASPPTVKAPSTSTDCTALSIIFSSMVWTTTPMEPAIRAFPTR
ncbi:MAG TPA: carboxypeptidase-like regulatory domain-containing protein [Bryobacteraceae bacterium]|nr:carboxypeptidase-like regulatory domain-containing protein [Bryobacteraceae bacterium]